MHEGALVVLVCGNKAGNSTASGRRGACILPGESSIFGSHASFAILCTGVCRAGRSPWRFRPGGRRTGASAAYTPGQEGFCDRYSSAGRDLGADSLYLTPRAETGRGRRGAGYENARGRIDVTFDIFEDLQQFSGHTITYVNNEAMSAGALIAMCTDEIYFAPLGIIGAAAPVTGEGKDLEKTMKGKVVSYVTGKARAVAEGKGRYREQVVTAMIDDDTELKIDGKVLKEKGKLLTLTLTEASAKYGDPAQPLLAAGIAKDIDDLLTQKYGAGNYEKLTFEVTWSEKLAQILSMRLVVQALLALGALAIYIEFKIPGFGVFGITGAVLLGLVFFGSYFSGLSGHEPILVFAIGVILLALELAFFHTAGVFGIIGLMMMGGSLLWAMADFWPNQPISVAWSGDMLLVPLQNMLIALVVAGVLLALIARFLPHGWIWQRLAVGGAVSGAGVSPDVLNEQESLVGREGIAATSLFPSGQVEIDGRRHEARLEVGSVQAGTPIRVVRRTSFGLVVEEKKS